MTGSSPKIWHAGVFIGAIVSFVALGFFVIAVLVFNPAEQTILDIQENVRLERDSTSETALRRTINMENGLFPGTRFFPSAAGSRDALLHDNKLYIATSSALFEYSPAGSLLRDITYLNGLPAADFSDLARFNEELYLATSEGLALVGTQAVTTFTSKLHDNNITAMAVFNSRLVLGTESGQLLSFSSDGTISDEFIRIPNAPDSAIISVEVWRGRLAAATREEGLYLLEGGAFRVLDAGQGLPSSSISAVLATEEALYVATMAGLVRIDAALQQRVIPDTGMVSAIAAGEDGELICGTHAGELFTTDGQFKRTLLPASTENPSAIQAIVNTGGRTLVLTGDNWFFLTDDELKPFGDSREQFLKAPHISALTTDDKGNTWIGYFDRGLEVRSAGMRRSGDFIREELRYVKCLRYDSLTGAILAGTSKGLHFFEPGGGVSTLSADDGLISNEVNDVIRVDEGLIVAATGGGISLIKEEGVNSLNAFHGLSSNKALSLGLIFKAEENDSKQIAIGSLGGLDLLDSDLSITSYSPDSSRLPAHWVSAISPVDNGLALGTYGRGLAFLDAASGELVPGTEHNQTSINPLAMLTSGKLLLAGTLDSGLLVHNPEAGSWHQIIDLLPSRNVTALAAGNGTYLIGTDRGLVILEAGSIHR